MKTRRPPRVLALATVLLSMVVFTDARAIDEDEYLTPKFRARLEAIAPQDIFRVAEIRTSAELAEGVRLEADGKPIDIGELSGYAHAGPWIADVDGAGDRDLLVGDFPGYFWLFENEGSESAPVYTSRGKLQAGGEDAKTPVY